MSNFNDQLSRMKALMTYGSVNEDAKPISSYNIEYKAKAADGKYYGIIRENSKYFVKVATPGKEMIAEDYQYIGGITNKANYEYLISLFEQKKNALQESLWKIEAQIQGLDSMKDSLESGAEKMREMSDEERAHYLSKLVVLNDQNVRQVLSEVIWL